jgi:hypothetical protein
MPVGDTTADGQVWHQIFADDFGDEGTPLGRSCNDPRAFPRTTPSWDAYPWPWRGTPPEGVYCPGRTTSIHDGVMDIWLHSERFDGAWHHLIDAPVPVIKGYPSGNGQLYGRYVIEFHQPRSFPMFHVSWLLWPDSNNWPTDGEIDFPEADTSRTISAFVHWRGSTSGSTQDPYSTDTPIFGGWHQAIIEWLPSRCTLILDGRAIGNTTNPAIIPQTRMHLVIQNGIRKHATLDNTTQGHILIDWIAIYAPEG